MELSHVLFILMIVFFLGGAGLIRLKKRMSREIKDWHYTKGVIVRNKVVKRPRRHTAFPTVQYVVEEKTYEYTSDLAQNPWLRKGKKVGVYYDPNDCGRARIDTFTQRGDMYTFLGSVLIGFGLVFLYVLYSYYSK